MGIYSFFAFVIIHLVMLGSSCTQEAVQLTLLARSYIIIVGERTNRDYQCYVSNPNVDVREDVTMTSSRVVWTRNNKILNPDPPPPTYQDHNLWPRYLVSWDDSVNNNDVFGVFSCTGEISGKEATHVAHIRMRSDADIVPKNGLLSQTVNINDTEVTINMMEGSTGSNGGVTMFRWNKNNMSLPSADGSSNYKINRQVTLDDGGVYECYIHGRRNMARQALNLLIVRKCPATRWGPPDCLNVCESCYNGGICDENTGKCVCAPGFSESQCKNTCGRNSFGHRCEFRCTSNQNKLDACIGNLYCLNHPFGCRCITGFGGLDCNEECPPGTFGASCLQTCHCATNVPCDRYTGVCSDFSCSSGWTGTNCQECEGNFFGSDCTKECHCEKQLCNSETGLCKSGGCLEKWVDLFPPFSCQTGLVSIKMNLKQNPGIPGWVACVAFEGAGGDLDSLELVILRHESDLDMKGITSGSVSREGSNKTQRFTVSSVNEGDVFYCQLRQSGRRLAMTQVTAETYALPVLSSPPEVVSVNGTSVTITWSQWQPGEDIGDEPVVGYRLYYREKAGTIWSFAAYVNAAEDLTHLFIDLKPETNYSLSVAAVREGDGGEGPRSPSQNTTTQCKVPPSPLSVSSKMSEGESFVVIVSWQLPPVLCSSNVTHLTIYYQSLSSEGESGKQLIHNTSVMSYALTGLSRDVEYDISMTLSTSGGESDRSDSSKIVPSGSSAAVASSITGCIVLFVIILLVVILLRRRRQGQRKNDFMVYKKESSSDLTTNDKAKDNSFEIPMRDEEEEMAPHIAKERPISLYANVHRPPPIRVTDFLSYVSKCQSSSVDIFYEQFMLFKQGEQYQCNVGRKEENKQKNRFKNMLPYDHSRVVLELEIRDPHSDYYNASYIKGHSGDRAFIACQGPNKASLNDFWRMIWQNKIENIVMLTNLVERGKERCRQYWPEAENESRLFGYIHVTWLSTESVADYCIRLLDVILNDETRTIRIFHFLTWPDMDIPDQPTQLITMTKRVKSKQEAVSSPLVVHCSAGIGRTGTFIALYTLLDELYGSGKIDVFGYVDEMRENRIDMIQRPTQYAFLHDCLFEEYITGESWIPRESMLTFSIDDNIYNLENQIKILAKLDKRDKHSGKPSQHSDRMRDPYVTPASNKLLFIQSKGRTNPDGYIHAFNVDSYLRRQNFIVTQSPLPNTVEDFWRLVFDYRCSLIVMLNQIHSNDERCVQYWPDYNVAEYGYITVELLDTEERVGYSYRHFSVHHQDSQRDTNVRHVQINKWDENDPSDILNFIDEVRRLQEQYSSDSPALVHCTNSVGRSGIILCVNSEIERVRTEGRFNVFNTVRKLRASNQHFLKSVEDYASCHHLLKQRVCPTNDAPVYANLTEL